MSRATARVFLVSIALAVIGWWSCAGGRTPLVLYSPHGRDLLTLLENAFEAENPEVDVRWLDMGSQEIYDRLRSEAANPQADVWFGGPDTIFSRGAEIDLLEVYRPSWADQVPAASQQADSLYFGVYRAVPLLIYNSDAVAAEDAPADWDDLLDSRWQGQIVLREPLASGTMRTAFGRVLANSVERTGSPEEGFDWLLRLDGQTKEYAVNPALLFEKIIRQEGLVSIWELTDMLFQQQRGAPLGYRFPVSGTPVIDDAIGLVAGGPQPEVARRFIDWVGSLPALQLAAEQAFRLPARTDLPADQLPPWARDALEQIVVADVDWQLMAREGEEWMGRWDREVRGQGDVGLSRAP